MDHSNQQSGTVAWWVGPVRGTAGAALPSEEISASDATLHKVYIVFANKQNNPL